MIYYTYKITSLSGKYYIGRHSTINLNDGYMGSGRWVRNIKDKSTLNKEILKFFKTIDKLREAENELLLEHIGKPGCMNFNNNSYAGFKNRNQNEAEKIKRSKAAKNLFECGQHNFQKQEVKEKRLINSIISSYKQLKNGCHAFQGDNGSKSAKQLLKEGRHNFQKQENREKVYAYFTCPCCGKVGKGGSMHRWHFDNCRQRSYLNEINH